MQMYSLIATAGLMLAAAMEATAQTPPPVSDNQQVPGSGALEEIVVTAQKRSQNEQDVPVSVESFSADALASANVNSIMDLSKLDPSLVMNAGQGVANPFIRGSGTLVNNVGDESSVAVYLDGVYLSRVPLSYLDLNSIERVEVLDGPQGTLFGRNSSGGLVQIITRDPSLDAPVLNEQVGYAKYDTVTEQFYGSVPLTSRIAFDVAAVYRRQFDGWGQNVNNGLPIGFDDHGAVRTKWLFEVSDDTTIKLWADYSRANYDQGLPDNVYRGTTLGNLATGLTTPLGPVGFYDSRAGVHPHTIDNIYSVEGRVTHNFSFMNVSSLTAYVNSHGGNTFDGGYQATPFLDIQLNEKNQQLSEELQFASNSDSWVTWTAGLYYLDETAGYPGASLSGPAFAPLTGVTYISTEQTASYAGYSQVTVPIVTRSDNITAGIRYTHDALHGYGLTLIDQSIIAPGSQLNNRTSFNKPSYKASYDHHFDADIMAYASVSDGFKDGTYNTLPISAVAVQPETTTSYELGMKSEFFDHRMRVNGALFWNKIDNLQVQEIKESLTDLVNAGGAVVKGIDFSVDGKVTQYLSARINTELLPTAHYTTFVNAPFTSPNPNAPFGNFPYTSESAGGDRLPVTAHSTIKAGLDYRIPTDIGPLLLSADWSYNSGYFWTPDHEIRQDAYDLLGGSAKWTSPDNRWSATLWAANITGTKYYLYAAQQGNAFGVASSPAAPRTFGIRVSFKM
jgi:iron complex outermembrane receptor protein